MEKNREKDLSKQRHLLCLVGKRGGVEAGPSTPSPTWRLEMFASDGGSSNSAKQFLASPLNNSAVSARKLCAILWEIHPQNIPPARMRKGAPKPLRKVKIDAGFDFDHSDVEPHRVCPFCV